MRSANEPGEGARKKGGERRERDEGKSERGTCMHTRGHCAMAADGLCSVADGGAKRLSDFVVDPDSSLRRLSLPGFPLLPRVAFRLSRRLRYAANAP